MKKMSAFFVTVISISAAFSSIALATDGQSTGCYTMAVMVPASISDANTRSAVLATKAVLCTTEKNMVSNPNDLTAVGEIKIRITENGKVVAKYDFGASTSEGALGTFYTTYGKTINDVIPDKDGDVDKSKVVTFVMRNDHIKAGSVAGHVEINGDSIYLIQR